MAGNYGAHCSRELHMAVGIQYVYDFIIKLLRQHVQVMQNHENENVCFAQGKTQYKGCKTANSAAVKHTTTQMTTLLLK